MDQFRNLPLPIKILLAVLSGGCLIGAAYMVDARAMRPILLGLLGVALIFGLYLFIVRLMQRSRSAGLGGDISQHSAVAPRGISEPARRAKLDDLRQNFQKGLERFRAAGKDLYSLPWYMVVGEPGSGKSEAIRHCNVGFPTGLQDELQGAGGTINMHWWFTNHAVLLDTAGRLMFEEVQPGATSEWREFLALLRKSRGNCPINGLILVIPADSLLKDSADVIARKAGRIAQQLSVIQTALDVRFPVFVAITKCDLINGFREFFNDLTDPQLQHQMLGWSNPDSLDEAFRPELVDDHIRYVVNRIRRRRFGLMQDPTAQNDPTAGRRVAVEDTGTTTPFINMKPLGRLDEVDALFSLPASMSLLAPRLKRYLEMIFTPSEWSSKPLFLRGIYFASAMREGSALDLELAEAIGVPVDSLPEGKTWERERTYFLRDLFLEKIFKERGLVTRATNTRRMLRQRQMLLFGGGFLGLFLLLTFSWIGARSLRDSVGREREFWLAANEGWQGDNWQPIVSPEFKGSANYAYNGDLMISVGQERIPLHEFHRRLADLARADISVPLVFRPWNSLGGSNPSRRRAQRIIFETGVVAPLVNAAREKVMLPGATWTPSSSEALAFLLQIEGAIQQREGGLPADGASAAAFFQPLGHFLYGAAKPDADLSAAFDWVYFKGGDGRGTWPPPWLSAGLTLTENRPIAVGLVEFIHHAVETQKAQAAGFELIEKVRGELRLLRHNEDELARLAAQSTGISDPFRVQGEKVLGDLLTQVEVVDRVVEEAGKSRLFDPKQTLLFTSYNNLVEETRKQTGAAFQMIQEELDRFPAAAIPTDSKTSAYTLPAEIRRQLQKVQQEMKAKTEGTFTGEELSELKEIDARFLDRSGQGAALYLTRGAVYKEALGLWHETGSRAEPIIGRFDQSLGVLQKTLDSIREKISHYQGAFAPEFTVTARRIVEVAGNARIQNLYARYFDEMDARFRNKLSFPLLRGGNSQPLTLAALREANALVRLIRRELPTMKATAPSGLTAKFELFENLVQRVGAVGDAMLAEEGQPTAVVVTLLSRADQRRTLMKQLGTEEFGPKFIGNIWRTIRFGTERFRSESSADKDIGRVSVSDSSLLLDFFKFDDDAQPDRHFTITGPWAILRLIQEPFVRRLAGGKEWEVMLSLRDENAQDRYILLILKFERPFPDIDQWPTIDTLNLERR